MDKFPPYAIGQGLDAAGAYLNEDSFKESMYPPESDEPFVWSSEKQRRAYFATNGFGKGIPYNRTHNLMYSGRFVVDKKYSSLYITYENSAPYFQYVQGYTSQIIGMKVRGWKPASDAVIRRESDVFNAFHEAVSIACANFGDFGL
jgi:hypothetical protein